MIRQRVKAMQDRQIECLGELLPLLAENGIRRLTENDLSDVQRDFLHSHFENEIYSSVAPIGIADGASIPFLGGLRLHLCVRVQNDADSRLVAADESGAPEDRFVIVPMPKNLARIWAVPTTDNYSFMLLEDVVAVFLDELLDGQKILDWTPFRITRNGDVELVEDDARADLLRGMEEIIVARKTSDCVRLEISGDSSVRTRQFLQSSLEVSEEDTIQLGGPLGLVDLFSLSGMQGFKHLKNDSWPPFEVPDFEFGSDVFATIAAQDRLVHHPYQSYESVSEFHSCGVGGRKSDRHQANALSNRSQQRDRISTRRSSSEREKRNVHC